MRSGIDRPALPGGLSVVLPAYNEAENLPGVVNTALTVLPTVTSRFEILVVNDASQDDTGRVVQNLADAHPGVVHHLCHSRNLGYGAALRTGFSAARLGHVFFTDSDGQFDLAELPAFLDGVELYRCTEVIVGYRKERRDPLHRTMNALAWGSLMRLLFEVSSRDIDCAYKIAPAAALRAADLRADGAFVSTELLAKLTRLGLTIHERPVTHHPRLRGVQTGASPQVIVRAFRELFSLTLQTWQFGRAPRPTLPAVGTAGGPS